MWTQIRVIKMFSVTFPRVLWLILGSSLISKSACVAAVLLGCWNDFSLTRIMRFYAGYVLFCNIEASVLSHADFWFVTLILGIKSTPQWNKSSTWSKVSTFKGLHCPLPSWYFVLSFFSTVVFFISSVFSTSPPCLGNSPCLPPPDPH